MTGEYLAMDLPELRRQLESHLAERPQDLFGKEMQTWMKTKGRIAFAIELKEAEAAQPPFYITVPPQPFELKPQPLLRLRKTPSAPTPEAPMPRTNPTRHHNPEARIAHLVERIKDATRKGAKPYWMQQEIRDLCAAHGLEVPPEAFCRRLSKKTEASQVAAPTPAPPPEDRLIHAPHLAQMGEDVLYFVLKARTLTPQDWGRIARELALLESNAGAARKIAEFHAEVA